MTTGLPRVAFFTDCFHEINGVALTSRQFQDFARRRQTPFLSVHTGPSERIEQDGALTVYEWKRGPIRLGLDADLSFDLLFWRQIGKLRAVLEKFRPDVIHITSPGDCGICGAILAWRMGIPLVASWHTNIHQFGARRLERMFHWLPEMILGRVAAGAEEKALDCTLRFYRLARHILAPNHDLMQLISSRTGRPCSLMRRGIDTGLFHPSRRKRNGGEFVLGYVGRIKPEKNVRLLAKVERELIRAGVTDYRFVVVGHGDERSWLAENLKRADFPGVLRGEALAAAYADMDLFVFPSHTDTYGNVVQEALASGVPPVVMAEGGPRFLVRHGETGLVAASEDEFCRYCVEAALDREWHSRLRAGVRDGAPSCSWDSVFEDVYSAYRTCLSRSAPQPVTGTPLLTPN